MVEVIVFAEGQTEEKFIKLVVAPNLKQLKVFLKPETLRTSTDAKGGAVNFDRLKFYARHINDSYETKPSKRLENLLQPKNHKTRHGPLAAERITLAVMERECRHFRGWMDKLRGLAAS